MEDKIMKFMGFMLGVAGIAMGSYFTGHNAGVEDGREEMRQAVVSRFSREADFERKKIDGLKESKSDFETFRKVYEGRAELLEGEIYSLLREELKDYIKENFLLSTDITRIYGRDR